MRRSLVSILFAPFCFAAIAAIVSPSSRINRSFARTDDE
jgi:hypothetical protein